MRVNPEIQAIIDRLFAGFVIPDDEWDAISDDDLFVVVKAVTWANEFLIAADGGTRLATAEEISCAE